MFDDRLVMPKEASIRDEKYSLVYNSIVIV